MAGWIFRTTHDHVDLLRYASEVGAIEHLATPGAGRIRTGEPAFLWICKTHSPFGSGGFDGRVIYATGLIEGVSPERTNIHRIERFLLDGPHAAKKLAAKANKPHAMIKLRKRLTGDRVIRWEELHDRFDADHRIFRVRRHTLVEISDEDAARIADLRPG